MSSSTVVAVTAASRPLGRAVVARLVDDPDVARVVVLDAAATAAHTDAVVRSDGEADLSSSLRDVDVVVHEALPEGLAVSEEQAFAAAVTGTRQLLAAVEDAGVGRIVHVSSAATYGAHADNDVPLTEESPLRAGPELTYGYHQLLAEELVAAWAADHPDVAVAVLRPVTILGTDVDDLVSRHLESPRLPLVKGHQPPVQFVAVEDVAAAVHVAVSRGLRGPHNVAADGWLAVSEVVALLGRKPLWVPEQVALSTGRQLWLRGVLSVPPGALRYLMHPWVVSSDRLRAAGWAPSRSNREVLRSFAAAHDAYLSVGRVRLRRRRILAAAAAGTGAATALGGALLVHLRRRHRGDL